MVNGEAYVQWWTSTTEYRPQLWWAAKFQIIKTSECFLCHIVSLLLVLSTYIKCRSSYVESRPSTYHNFKKASTKLFSSFLFSHYFKWFHINTTEILIINRYQGYKYGRVVIITFSRNCELSISPVHIPDSPKRMHGSFPRSSLWNTTTDYSPVTMVLLR